MRSLLCTSVLLLGTAVSPIFGCKATPPRTPIELASELRRGDEGDREDAAKDLRKYPDALPEVLPHVFAALQVEKDADIYGELLVTLGHWGVPAAQPYIEGGLSHPDGDISRRARKALSLWSDRNPGRAPLPPGQAVAPPAVKSSPRRVATWNKPKVDGALPDCWRDGDGQEVCGFNCAVSGERVGCAATPYGYCSANGDEVRCVDGATILVGGMGPAAAPARAPECKMGADGMNACGYNCKVGSNGKAYCSSVANGACALNADGTYTCP
jgi:hypothetical protein